MNFGWIKKLLNKKIEFNNETSDVATIDTSLVFVPKFKDLTDEEKIEVLKELNELNNNNDYNTLLKFSSDLVDISNRERFILTKTLERYYDWFDSSKNPSSNKTDKEKLGDSLCFGLLSNLEFEIIVKNLLDVKEKLILKAVAIDELISKKEKERKPLRELFKHAEKIEYNILKKRLLSEEDRIKVSLKINDQILRTIYIDIQENDTLRKEYSVLQQILDNSDDKTNNNIKEKIIESLNLKLYHYTHVFIGTEYDDIFINDLKSYGNKLVGMKTPQSYLSKHYNRWKPTTYTKYLNKNKIITQDMVDEAIRLATENGEDCDFEDLIDLVPTHKLEDFFKFVAEVFHNMEVFCYEHKEDYKKYIEDIRTTINDYEETSTSNWNNEKLIELTRKYDYELYAYLELLKNYLTEDNKNELINQYTKLLFLCKLKGKSVYYKVYGWLGHFYREIEKNECELLSKVEDKYGISLYDKKDKKSREKFVRENEDYIINLYDLLQGNNDILKTKINTGNDSFVKKYNALLKKHDESIFEFYYYMINGEISIYEYYYLTKLINMSFDDSCKMAMKCENLLIDKEACDTQFAKLITMIKLNELEKKYDNRIIFAPVNLTFRNFEKVNSDKNIIDELITDDNQIAIYLPKFEQLIQIVKLEHISDQIKYVMVEDYNFNEYIDIFIGGIAYSFYHKYIYDMFSPYDPIPEDLKEKLNSHNWSYFSYSEKENICYEDIRKWISNNKDELFERFKKANEHINFIIIPDSNYSIKSEDLSNYLDKEIALEKEQQKVLSKKI